MADTIMVSTAGQAAMSGVSLVDSINLLLMALFTAMATGGAVICSQYLGRQEQERASAAARQLVYVVLGISCMIMLVSLVFRKGILALVYGSIEADVMTNAVIYMTITAISFPFLALYNAGAALFRSMGNSRVSMLIALAMNLINVTGNAITIFGFGMGVAGAALSTLVARAFAAITITALLARSTGDGISLRGVLQVKLDKQLIGSITRVGVPNGIENSVFHVGKILVTRLISSFGTSAIAANATVSSLATFINIPGNAISLALLTVVGQNVGARNFAGARRDYKRLMRVVYICMTALSGLFYLLRYPLIGLYNLSPEATAMAAECITIVAIGTPLFWPTSFSLPSALRATGDTKYTMAVSIFSMWAFRIGLAYLFGGYFELGVAGVWIAMCVDWIVRGSLFLWRWTRGKWENIQVIA